MRVALATGAGHRLGRELALGLGRAGYTVAVHYRSHLAEAEETLRLLAEAGARGETFSADFEEEGAAAGLVRSVLARLGRLDALVHGASPWIEKPLDLVSVGDWESIFRAGPRAAFFLAQAAAPALSSAEGSILLVSDVAAVKAWPRNIPHSAAKAAVNALVVNLARALGPRVRVNGIAPGTVLPPEGLSAQTVASLVSRTPLGRIVGTRDLVDMAMAVLQNRSMTGQVVSVDAGLTIV